MLLPYRMLQEPNVTKVGSDGCSSRIGCAGNRTLLRLAAMNAPPVGMRVGTSISALRKLHKMLLVPQKPLFPGPGHDARFARLRQDGAPNKGPINQEPARKTPHNLMKAPYDFPGSQAVGPPSRGSPEVCQVGLGFVVFGSFQTARRP